MARKAKQSKVETKSKLVQVAALWSNTDRNGKPYLNGVVEIKGEKIAVFGLLNKGKSENPKRPDWQLFLSRENRPRQ